MEEWVEGEYCQLCGAKRVALRFGRYGVDGYVWHCLNSMQCLLHCLEIKLGKRKSPPEFEPQHHVQKGD